MQRTLLALDGLSVADALGSQAFVPRNREAFEAERVPPGPWLYTDDTEMALGIVQVLRHHGQIDPGILARVFAHRWDRDMLRGYGGGAHLILGNIRNGKPWQEAAMSVFNGQGSMGNGGAMRVAPLGAYFAEDDWPVIVEQARLSAIATHGHPDGQAGAIAIAVAAACAWRMRGQPLYLQRQFLWQKVLELTPQGPTRMSLNEAHGLSYDVEIEAAVQALGNGSRVVSWDTVPFCVWCATRHLDDFQRSMWTTFCGGGDIDTTAAIVGGIVALSAGRESIPIAWLEERESLDYEAMRPPPDRDR